MYRDLITVLSSKKVKFSDEGYTLLNVVNVLASTKIDITNYDFKDDTLDIKHNNILGDVTIITNGDTKVVLEDNSILGSSKYDGLYRKDYTNTIYIRGLNILGSVTIK